MSRGYNARRKARRAKSRVESERRRRPPSLRPRRLNALVPIAAIILIFAAVGAFGFGGNSDPSLDRKQIREEVGALLAGIPQQGATLGSPDAPLSIKIFGDLECPTVKRFVSTYLPSLVMNWVRDGTAKLEYRSLETDTTDEHTFYEQEIAALAAGRQSKMWNFLLTFLYEQEQANSGYVTESFMTGIASQVPGLNASRWRRDRKDLLLFNQVALGLHAAHENDFTYTPSFVIDGATEKDVIGAQYKRNTLLRNELEQFLREDIEALREGTSQDIPTLLALES